MRLLVLPDELRVDCAEFESFDAETKQPTGEHPYAGLTAVLTPLDVEGRAQWFDAFPDEGTRNAAAAWCVQKHLKTIDGLTMVEPDGREVPYDHAKPAHWRSLPTPLVAFFYAKLLERATVTEAQEKNSDSPSGSVETRPSDG